MKKKSLLHACQQYDFKKIQYYFDNFHLLNGKQLVAETNYGQNIFTPSYQYDNWLEKYTQLVDLLLSNKLILKMVKVRESPFENLFFDLLNIGNMELVKRLLDCNYDINQKNSKGDNALLHCISNKYSEKTFSFLIKEGIDINYKNNKMDALSLAIIYGQESIASLLIESNIEINQDISLKNGKKNERYVTNLIELALDHGMFTVALKIIQVGNIDLHLLEKTYFYLDKFQANYVENIKLLLEEKINITYEKDTIFDKIDIDENSSRPQKRIKI